MAYIITYSQNTAGQIKVANAISLQNPAAWLIAEIDANPNAETILLNSVTIDDSYYQDLKDRV